MKLLLVSVACLLGVTGLAGDSPAARVPVLIELFTSEGCSSCPPADRLLEKLDKEQPVPGAELVVLSEHVDYWNQLGWSDPFSSALYTQRQRDYASALHGEVYTPEMVVDGAKGFVGSDEEDARRSVKEAVKTGKSGIHIETRREDNKAKILIRMDHAADGALYLALAHESAKSQVLRGENGGRALSHVAVVYSLQKVGKLERNGAGFEREVTATVQPGTRIVAFVEKGGVGRVTAIGQGRL
jgi:hypothetical protein